MCVFGICVCVWGGWGGFCLYEHYIHLFPSDRASEESVKLCMNMLSQSRLVCRTVPLFILLQFAAILHNRLLLLYYILTFFSCYSRAYCVLLIMIRMHYPLVYLRLLRFSSARNHVWMSYCCYRVWFSVAQKVDSCCTFEAFYGSSDIGLIAWVPILERLINSLSP